MIDFNYPKRLYGRDHELKALLNAYRRIKKGAIELLFIKGNSGTGKSVLVEQFEEIIESQAGYLISGKCDVLQRNIPYFPIIQAFEESIDDILNNESPESIAQIKRNILLEVGQVGKVLTDLIPKLELLIGKQKEIPVVTGQMAQNRFNYVFQKFIRAISTADSPIVFFLDDLQWIDAASLRLLETLATDPSNHHILFLGSYRDNEVTPDHPLTHTINLIKAANPNQKRVIHIIEISDLSLKLIQDFLKDTLQEEENVVKSLAILVHEKTMGNPFFVKQYIDSLITNGLLVQNHNTNTWKWDINDIEATSITDNVVDLMINKFKRLSLPVQHILKLASCVGVKFSLSKLELLQKAVPNGTTNEQVIESLIAGEHEGIIALDDINYRFTHDQIYQTINNQLSETELQEIHLVIARVLYDRNYALLRKFDQADVHIEATQIPDDIFTIANHWNDAAASITSEEELINAAKSNLLAGIKAKNSAAYQQALDYLTTGINYLKADSWTSHYRLALILHVEVIDTEYLTGAFGGVEDRFNTIIKNAKTPLDTVKAHQSLISAYVAQQNLSKAVDTGLSILQKLKIHIPRNPTRRQIIMMLLKTRWMLLGQTPKSLLNKRLMTDKQQLAAMNIVKTLSSAIYFSRSDLLPYFLLKSLQVSLKHGNAPTSVISYGGYGYLQANFLEKYKKGQEFGEIAMGLLEQFPVSDVKIYAYLINNAFISHWHSHIRNSLKPLLTGYQHSMEAGSHENAAYFALVYVYRSFYSGLPLGEVEQLARFYANKAASFKQETTHGRISLYLQTIINIRTFKSDPTTLNGEAFDEFEMLALNTKNNIEVALVNYYINKTLLCFLYEEYDLGIVNAHHVRTYMHAAMGTLMRAIFMFIEGLVIIAAELETPVHNRNKKQKIAKVLRTNEKALTVWSKNCTANFEHKLLFLKGAIEEWKGNTDQAIAYFRQGASFAEQENFMQEAALGYELTARLYHRNNRFDDARRKYRLSKGFYEKWGAKGKVEHLKRKYPQYF